MSIVPTSEAERITQLRQVVGGSSGAVAQAGAAPRYEDLTYRLGKRIFDIVLSLVGMLVLAPVFLLTAIYIALVDGVPVIFRQKRVGLDGREFWILKFRSMRQNAEQILRDNPALMAEYRKSYKLTNDPRLIKGGSWMRKTSLDELPQLMNVFKGEMSLVGPRPILRAELEKYGSGEHIYLAMKPGCAGLWQCSGRSDLSYDERVQLDMRYYETASLRNDALILIKTVIMALSRRGAV